jgi:hypothetical protein
MRETIKKLVEEKIQQMDSGLPWEGSLGSLSVRQKQVFHDVLIEVMKEMSPHFKNGMILVIQVLVQVLTARWSKQGEKKQ